MYGVRPEADMPMRVSCGVGSNESKSAAPAARESSTEGRAVRRVTSPPAVSAIYLIGSPLYDGGMSARSSTPSLHHMLEYGGKYTCSGTYRPLVPAPMYRSRPPFCMRSTMQSITAEMAGVISATAAATNASCAFMSRHISSVLSVSMSLLAGFRLSVDGSWRSGGCVRGGETRAGGVLRGEVEADANGDATLECSR